MAQTNIEWCHTWRPDGTYLPGWTFNPWRGCTKVSPGCKFCYAETFSHRNPAVLGEWGPQGRRSHAAENNWRDPLRWNAAARQLEQIAPAPRRPRVFCASLGDVWEDNPALRAPRRRLLRLIQATPYLDWLLVTCWAKFLPTPQQPPTPNGQSWPRG
jgi:protein gp37